MQPTHTPRSAVDPDVDLSVPAQRRELVGHHPSVLLAIAVGGALGSAARYGVGVWLPDDAGRGLPWATLVINVVGCFLIGVLMVTITEWLSAHPLVRPLLGVGVLGGFTTFSTYTNEIRILLARGAAGAGLAYLALTVVAAVTAVAVGAAVTRLALRLTHRGSGLAS